MIGSELETRLLLISGMAESFSKKLSQNALEMYADALSDIPLEKMKAAIKKLMGTKEFFPPASEIREMTGGNLLPSPAEENAAWRKRWGITE